MVAVLVPSNLGDVVFAAEGRGAGNREGEEDVLGMVLMAQIVDLEHNKNK